MVIITIRDRSSLKVWAMGSDEPVFEPFDWVQREVSQILINSSF